MRFSLSGFLVTEPGAAGHFHATFFVDSEALGGDDVAFFDDVFNVFGAAFGEFRDVDESVLAREHFHECAELGDGNHLAGVNLAHFDFLEHAIDHRLGAIEAFLLGSVDVHGAVVLDVDLGAGLGLDAFDVLAAWSNELANAVCWDFDGNNAWGVRAERLGLDDGLGHLFDDLGAAGLGDVDRFFKHGEREAGELEVELVAGDTFAGAAKLEVHVAVEIFGPDDVEEHLVGLHRAVFVVLSDETHGNTTDRADERDPGVEESHGACANGGHRGGTVGFHDFRGNADGVGEDGFVRDDRLDGALGERAVADFATVDATHASAFADGEWREVVVEDEAFFVFATGVVVEMLLLVGGCQRGDGERLSFSAGENGGAVNAWQGANFAVKSAEVTDGTAVGSEGIRRLARRRSRLLLERAP